MKVIGRWENTKVYPYMLNILARVKNEDAWDRLVKFAKEHPFNEDGGGIENLQVFGNPEAIPFIESIREETVIAKGQDPSLVRLHLFYIDKAIRSLQEQQGKKIDKTPVVN